MISFSFCVRMCVCVCIFLVTFSFWFLWFACKYSYIHRSLWNFVPWFSFNSIVDWSSIWHLIKLFERKKSSRKFWIILFRVIHEPCTKLIRDLASILPFCRQTTNIFTKCTAHYSSSKTFSTCRKAITSDKQQFSLELTFRWIYLLLTYMQSLLHTLNTRAISRMYTLADSCHRHQHYHY